MLKEKRALLFFHKKIVFYEKKKHFISFSIYISSVKTTVRYKFYIYRHLIIYKYSIYKFIKLCAQVLFSHYIY